MTEATLRIRQQSRLAITVRDPNTDVYPAREDQPNTYWIVFVDGQYTKAQGNQVHSLHARQNLDEARAVAHNLLDGEEAYVEENTLIEVTWHSRQWWFYYGAQAAPSSSSSGSSGSSSGEESSGESSSGEESSGSSSAPCANTIGGAALSSIPGYDGAKTQFLRHVNGCLEWITAREC